MAEQRIAARRGAGRHVEPADLRLGRAADVTTERVRQQLRSEADAEHGTPVIEGVADHAQLVREMRKALGLVDVHRTAQDDQRVVAVDLRLRLRVPREVDVADPEAFAAEVRVEGSENFVGGVLEDEKLGHGPTRAAARDLQFKGPAPRAASTKALGGGGRGGCSSGASYLRRLSGVKTESFRSTSYSISGVSSVEVVLSGTVVMVCLRMVQTPATFSTWSMVQTFSRLPFRS